MKWFKRSLGKEGQAKKMGGGQKRAESNRLFFINNHKRLRESTRSTRYYINMDSISSLSLCICANKGSLEAYDKWENCENNILTLMTTV